MTFELDRFAWTLAGLEVSGRWRSETPRRFRHVRLVVEQDGRRRRIAPARQTPMRATPEGEPWAATFPWDGEEAPAAPTLEAGQSLLIELPPPTRVVVPAPAAPEADVEALRAELQAERELVAALKRRLAAERAKQEEAQAEEAAEHKRELAEAWKAAQELQAERSALAAEREQVEAEREQVAAARAELEAEREEVAAARAELEADRERLPAQREARTVPGRPAPALPAEAPERPPHRWNLGAAPHPANGSGPRHGAIQHALDLPRQPDDHVRGKAPLPVRIVAVALSAGVLVMLALIIAAIL